MRITAHIISLLYRYECVVIPEFGAFLTQRKPAQIHQTTHAFYPPKKSISFNRQLKDNDGVLANYIAKVEGISYQQSLSKIHDFVDNMNESLESHGQIHFDKIGTFYTRDGKILFQAFLQTNYLLEAFGTDSYTAEEIVREKTMRVSAEERVSVLQAPQNEQEEGSAKEIHPEADKDKKKKPVYWRYAAVGLLAIGLGGFLTANWYSSEIEAHNLAAQKQAEQQIEKRIQQATFVMENPLPEVIFKVTTERGKYHIVAGAFRQKENAQDKLNQLKKQGFAHAAYIGANKYGLHQVVYDSYKDRGKAVAELYKIKRQDNSSAWLLVQDL